MSAPATIDDFLAVARKSQQIDNERLDAFLSARRARALPAEPKKLAALLIREGLLTTFQAQQFLLGKHKGFTLGGYRIVERLGAGGTGTVYLAEHQVMKRRVALKILPTPFADDPAILERFRREAQAAAALDHPNVVHVYDFRKEGPLYFIVMEYIEGPNLQQMLSRRGALPVDLACDYIRQAALGLHHAHERGMVHRDIKPANLLVDANGLLKVLDLGLARYDQGGESQVTEKFNSNAVLGTADYLAPEQAMNLHGADSRADVYGLGATLYALLAGRPPFHNGSIGQKLMWHQTKEPNPVNAIRPEVPAELAAVVARMLAKNPDERLATAAEVAAALAPWAEEAQRKALHPSQRTLRELRLPRAEPMPATPSGRLLPGTPTVDTWVSSSQDDTAKIEAEEPPSSILSPPIPNLTISKDGSNKRVLILVGLAAVVGVLVGGVFAFLLWGPGSSASHHQPPANVSLP